MVGLAFLYLRKKRMAGLAARLAVRKAPVALTAISLTPTKEKDLESGAPGTKGGGGGAAAYSATLTKTPMGLGLTLSDDVVTEITPDSQAARHGRIKVG